MSCLLGPFSRVPARGTGEAGWVGAVGQERGCPALLVSKLVDHWTLSLAETLLPRPGRAFGLPQVQKASQ